MCQTIWENNKTPAGSRLAGVRCRGVHSQCVAFICTNLTLPTGNLDSKTSREILDILKFTNQKYKQTILLVTHDEKIALQANRIITIGDGKIIKDEVMK